ncbi:baseplate J/gp47 family protein [Sulfurovum mangrovi]|uniref:baseplate J/gp47 family protein n=1 Tax=Sulfurovum mangrovi TaxID=2893889 RepID=UPI001E380167|nr:baseplate J/gp47 family protein [Sulfurovum mangrovi]UFH59986.1 baseplate J/gp47 family protein [Sulfurovum mangrovi]
MGLEIPNLDQKAFETRIKEAVAKLPAYGKEWTEYNYSDPGITIIELLAWMADINSYRLNRIRDDHYEAFLELLGHHGSGALSERFIEVQKALETPYKAVTLDDFEYLTLQYPRVAKVKAKADKEANRVSVVVVPESREHDPRPSEAVKKKIAAYLQERALLTTEVSVVSPDYSTVNVKIEAKTRYHDPDKLKSLIRDRLQEYLHPVYGGKEKSGWEFGEELHISQIYMLLNRIEGIDTIDRIYFYDADSDVLSKGKTTITLGKNVLPISGKHSITVTNIQPLGSCP